jgi:hypothetical protein
VLIKIFWIFTFSSWGDSVSPTPGQILTFLLGYSFDELADINSSANLKPIAQISENNAHIIIFDLACDNFQSLVRSRKSKSFQAVITSSLPLPYSLTFLCQVNGTKRHHIILQQCSAALFCSLRSPGANNLISKHTRFTKR